MSNTNELKSLPTNKTHVLYSPVEGDDVLTRTGIKKESSLFHAILHATSTEYISMDEEGRLQFVKKLKNSLKDVMSVDDWKEIDGATRQFGNKLHFILLNFYRFINEDPKAKGKSTRKVIKSLIDGKHEKIEYYNILCQLIPFSVLQHKILKSDTSATIDEHKKNILKNIVRYLENLDEMKYLDKEKRIYFTKLSLDMFNTIFKEAEYSAYKLFLTTLTESNRTPSLLIHLLSLKLNRDIYILDSESRMPLNNPELIEKRRSIVLLLLPGNNHYEVVGKLHPGNKVQRDFSSDELFITKLQTFTCEQSRVSVLFPELIKYLPAEYRAADKEYVDSGVDTESDEDYVSDSEDNITEDNIVADTTQIVDEEKQEVANEDFQRGTSSDVVDTIDKIPSEEFTDDVETNETEKEIPKIETDSDTESDTEQKSTKENDNSDEESAEESDTDDDHPETEDQAEKDDDDNDDDA